MSSEKDFPGNLEDDELDNIITLTDEKGRDKQFELLDFIGYDDETYIVLLPYEDTGDADEVVILKAEDGESYVSVDDDETLEAVFEIFKEKFKDEFNFVD